MDKQQICNTCVMDVTSDPNILFYEDGTCIYCRNLNNVKKRFINKEKELEAIVSTIKLKTKKQKYNCIVGTSGGKDSFFLAQKIKELGLNALLVHFDNHWNSDVAEKNLNTIQNTTGFDMARYTIEKNSFFDLQKAFLKASVPEAETPTDIAILAFLYKAANDYDVPFIVSGCNYATEGILPAHWHYDCRDYKFIKSVHNNFGNIPINNFPVFNYKKEIYYKFVKKIKIIYLINYLDYNPIKVTEELTKKYNFISYNQKHSDSVYTEFIQKIWLPSKFNIDYRKATLSSKIVFGIITREEALNILAKPIIDDERKEELISIVSSKFQISKEELLEWIQNAPKTYQSYSNNKWFLSLLYKIYWTLKN